jgi:hypothetical protein
MSQLINVKTDILLLHGWPKKTLVQNISGACISKRRMQAGHENVVKVKAKFIEGEGKEPKKSGGPQKGGVEALIFV